MEISLFEHNEEAYKRLKQMLEQSRFATINHATGTGKSFIALKYLHDNNDKKYLYIAPTYEILNQLFERDLQKIGIDRKEINADAMIYRTLLSMDIGQLYEKYDGFILDEYHRAGATQTFTKIKELKNMVASLAQDKKIIGLTATPIRYLDRERDMTSEIFDGNEASFLGLAESIIEGILPAPKYINSPAALIEEYQKVQRAVNRLSLCDKKRKLNEMLDKIGQLIDPKTAYSHLFKEHLNKNGKYIIFSSNIGELYQNLEDSQMWFKDFDNIQRYVVHSRKSRDVNKVVLKKFNDAQDGLSLLYAVDILNEGVHVDNVDGVILNRRTTSPIIYFQQIGRALSSSNSEKEITIFDLVNNFHAHGEISRLYDDLQAKIIERITKDPENINRYEAMLSKLCILDKTKELLETLTEIKSQITYEAIIDSKIEYAIFLLENYRKDCNHDRVFVSYNINDKKVKQGYLHLFKYEKYVTNEQLRRLNQLNIILPSSLMVEPEERMKQLGGYESLFQKESAELLAQKENLMKFLRERVPSIDSEDEYEQRTFEIYFEILVNGKKEEKARLKLLLENKKLDIWEKILIGFSVSDEEIYQLLNQAELYNQNKQILPQHIKRALSETLFSNENCIHDKGIMEILEQNRSIEKLQIGTKVDTRNKCLQDLLLYIKDRTDFEYDEDFLEKYDKLSAADRAIIDRRIYIERKRKYQRMFLEMKHALGIVDFVKAFDSLDEEMFEIYYSKIEDDKCTYSFLAQYIDFIGQNHRRPSNLSLNKNERNLANDFNKILQDSSFQADEIIELIGDDIDLSREENSKRLDECFRKDLTCRYIRFAVMNGRRPLDTCLDSEEEKMLAQEFNENLDSYTETEISAINAKLNRSDILSKTGEAFTLNKHRQIVEQHHQSKQKKISATRNGRKVNRIW